VKFDRETDRELEVCVQTDETAATYKPVVILPSPLSSLDGNFVSIIKSQSINYFNLFMVRGYWCGNYWG
jgi:hypothetical protein